MIKRPLDDMQLHFIVAKERTGSSLLVSLLNEHPNILSTSEEPFLLYFYHYYKNKDLSNPKIIREFIDDFWWMQEENLSLYFSSKEKAISQLEQLTGTYVKKHSDIDFLTFCKAVYLQFLPQKDKSEITTLVDKQLKYNFHLNNIQHISPESKFIFLIREPKDNINSCIKRHLGPPDIAFQSELWNIYTSPALFNNIPAEKKMIVHYEDLILNTEKTVNTIIAFLGLPTIHLEYTYQEHFEQLIETKKNAISKQYYETLRQFHSGLLSPIDQSKIGEWQKNLTIREKNKIEWITRKNARKLNYQFQNTKSSLTLKDYLMILYAKLYKLALLKVYYRVPLKIKVWIKKIKPQNNER